MKMTLKPCWSTSQPMMFSVSEMLIRGRDRRMGLENQDAVVTADIRGAAPSRIEIDTELAVPVAEPSAQLDKRGCVLLRRERKASVV